MGSVRSPRTPFFPVIFFGGPGLLEDVYEEALAWELKQLGLKTDRQWEVSMDSPEGLFDEIATQLAKQPGVVRAKMFGMPSVKVNGNAFMGFRNGAMVFKLTGESHKQALAVPGARLFDAFGRGRLMKEWVSVPASASDLWTDLADAALAYVATLPMK